MRKTIMMVAAALALAGCCTPQVVTDKTLVAAEGTLNSLEIMQREIPPLLSDEVVEVRADNPNKRTVRAFWVKRIASYIVRARSVVAGLKVDKDFSVLTEAEKEGLDGR